MAYYDKKVIYLSETEYGNRIKGAGFVKMECRGESCSFDVHISGLWESAEKKYDINVISVQGKEYTIGKIFLHGGSGEWKACYGDGRVAAAGSENGAGNGEGTGMGKAGETIGYWEIAKLFVRISDTKSVVGKLPAEKKTMQAAELASDRQDDGKTEGKGKGSAEERGKGKKGTEKTETEKTGAGKAGAGKTETEKTGTGKAGAEKTEAEKAGTEKTEKWKWGNRKQEEQTGWERMGKKEQKEGWKEDRKEEKSEKREGEKPEDKAEWERQKEKNGKEKNGKEKPEGEMRDKGNGSKEKKEEAGGEAGSGTGIWKFVRGGKEILRDGDGTDRQNGGLETKLHMDDVILNDKWDQLKQIYSVVHPYEDDRQYIAIQPKDFVIMTGDYQHLANNSFLLHGFYNYRHIILGREPDGSFYLGVPGVYYEREKMVALMFGFEAFECEGGIPEAGKFGYYLRRVKI